MFKQHALSKCFPPMGEAEFKALVEDIRANGLLEPITLYQEQVLDGWNRQRACKEAGKTPKYQKYVGKDPVSFVLSKNWHRRHMNAGQRAIAMAAADAEKKSAPGAPEVDTSEIAEKADVSRRTAQQAVKVYKNGSDKLIKAVSDETISLKQANAIADLPKKEQDARIAEIKSGEKPEKKEEKPAFDPKKCQNRDTCLLAQELEEMRGNYQVMADELKTAESLMGTDAAKEMLQLREQVRVLQRRVNELLTTKTEAVRQSDWWKKAAIKAGYKPNGEARA